MRGGPLCVGLACTFCVVPPLFLGQIGLGWCLPVRQRGRRSVIGFATSTCVFPKRVRKNTRTVLRSEKQKAVLERERRRQEDRKTRVGSSDNGSWRRFDEIDEDQREGDGMGAHEDDGEEEAPLESRRERQSRILAQSSDRVTFVFSHFNDPTLGWSLIRTLDSLGVREVHVVGGLPSRLATPRMLPVRCAKGSDKWVVQRRHSSLENAVRELRASGFVVLAYRPSLSSEGGAELDFGFSSLKSQGMEKGCGGLGRAEGGKERQRFRFLKAPLCASCLHRQRRRKSGGVRSEKARRAERGLEASLHPEAGDLLGGFRFPGASLCPYTSESDMKALVPFPEWVPPSVRRRARDAKKKKKKNKKAPTDTERETPKSTKEFKGRKNASQRKRNIDDFPRIFHSPPPGVLPRFPPSPCPLLSSALSFRKQPETQTQTEREAKCETESWPEPPNLFLPLWAARPPAFRPVLPPVSAAASLSWKGKKESSVESADASRAFFWFPSAIFPPSRLSVESPGERPGARRNETPIPTPFFSLPLPLPPPVRAASSTSLLLLQRAARMRRQKETEASIALLTPVVISEEREEKGDDGAAESPWWAKKSSRASRGGGNEGALSGFSLCPPGSSRVGEKRVEEKREHERQEKQEDGGEGSTDVHQPGGIPAPSYWLRRRSECLSSILLLGDHFGGGKGEGDGGSRESRGMSGESWREEMSRKDKGGEEVGGAGGKEEGSEGDSLPLDVVLASGCRVAFVLCDNNSGEVPVERLPNWARQRDRAKREKGGLGGGTEKEKEKGGTGSTHRSGCMRCAGNVEGALHRGESSQNDDTRRWPGGSSRREETERDRGTEEASLESSQEALCDAFFWAETRGIHGELDVHRTVATLTAVLEERGVLRRPVFPFFPTES